MNSDVPAPCLVDAEDAPGPPQLSDEMRTDMANVAETVSLSK